MTYGEILKNGFKTLIFDEKAVTDNANNESATGFGFLTLALTGVVHSIIPIILVGLLGVFSLILTPIFMIVGFIIGYSIFHFFAKIFGGTATGSQYFRSLSNVFVVYWLLFWIYYVPIIGNFLNILLSIWLVATNVFILHKIHNLSLVKAIIIGVVIPLVVMALLMLLGIFSLATMLSAI